MFRNALLSIVLVLPVFIYGQTFVDQVNNLPALQLGSAAWADYDQDGDEDVAIVGFSSQVAEQGFIFRNDNGIFTVVDTNILHVFYGSVNWGDYDNDHDLDLLINGQINGGAGVQLYRNDGNSVFTPVSTGFVAVQGIMRWLDIDNDGMLDVIVSGLMDSAFTDTTIVYRNQGGGNFSVMPTNLISFMAHDIAVSDYNNDSLPDLFVTGKDKTFFRAFSALFTNHGGGNFTMDSSSFRQLFTGTSKWGDAEGDGDLDILYDGIEDDNSAFSVVYLNDGNGNFTELTTNLPGTGEPGTVDWADMDHDGDLDIALNGGYLMRNDGGGNFTDVTPWQTGFFYHPVQFIDYDHDGDDDIFLMNFFGNSGSTIFRNDLINGIEVLNHDRLPEIFPNPACQYIELDIPVGQEFSVFRIYSLEGKLLRAVDAKYHERIKLDHLEAGIYFLEIIGVDKTIIKRFIKN